MQKRIISVSGWKRGGWGWGGMEEWGEGEGVREEDNNFHSLDLFRNEEEGRISKFSDFNVLRTERKDEKKRATKQLDEKEIQLERKPK